MNRDFINEIWDGLAAMLVALPSSIAFGILIFSAISPQLLGEGAFAGMIGAAAMGLSAPMLGRTPALISAPCAPAAAIPAMKYSYTPRHRADFAAAAWR